MRARLPQRSAERSPPPTQDIKREFPTVLVLGGAHCSVAKCVAAALRLLVVRNADAPTTLHRRRLGNGRAGIRKLIHVDSSQAQLDAAKAVPVAPGIEREFVCADEERLPLENGTVDCVVSSMGLHWLNDLPGAMVQCRRALRPDGLFLSAFLGGCGSVPEHG